MDLSSFTWINETNLALNISLQFGSTSHLCGSKSNYDIQFEKCLSLQYGDYKHEIELLERRNEASGLALNESHLWITGGVDLNGKNVLATEFVSSLEVSPGPDLPTPIKGHCMILVKTDLVALISPDKLLYLNLTSGFWSIKSNRTLETNDFACGRILADSSESLMLVVGGQNQQDQPSKLVKIGLLTSDDWTSGPNLPEPLTNLALVSFETFALTIGGKTGFDQNHVQNVYKFSCCLNFGCSWSMLNVKLPFVSSTSILAFTLEDSLMPK